MDPDTTIRRMTRGDHSGLAHWSPLAQERYRLRLLRYWQQPETVQKGVLVRSWHQPETVQKGTPAETDQYLHMAHSEYEPLIRRVLAPVWRQLRERLSAAAGADQAYRLLMEQPTTDIRELDPAQVRAYFLRLEGAHRAETIAAYQVALGVDVSALLQSERVALALARRTTLNVGLIRSIPRRWHGQIARDLRRMIERRLGDRQHLERYLASRWQKSGYAMRRLARDQTTKAVGGLTQIRQTELGISRYTWSTSRDDAVRETHSANEGWEFDWSSPPLLTGHPGDDIQCRCVAIPVIPARVADGIRDRVAVAAAE